LAGFFVVQTPPSGWSPAKNSPFHHREVVAEVFFISFSIFGGNYPSVLFKKANFFHLIYGLADGRYLEKKSEKRLDNLLTCQVLLYLVAESQRP
jgi:hypothetical protein